MCPRPPVRGDLPPACSRLSHQGNKAQSSALLTGVLPLWPWALGGWPEAAVQLWKGGALTPVPESCPLAPGMGCFVRMLATHCSPLASSSGRLLPPGPPGRARPLPHEGRGAFCCGAPAGPALQLTARVPGALEACVWRAVQPLSLSLCPALLQGTEPAGAQGHPCGLRVPCRGSRSSGPCGLTPGSTLALCLTSFSSDPTRERVRAQTGGRGVTLLRPHVRSQAE